MTDVTIALDPRDLINIPGAGRAEIASRATGAWDEGRAPDAVAWEVTVYASVTMTQVLKVRAKTEEEAEHLAICRAKADGDWRWDRDLRPAIDHSAFAREISE